MRYFCLWFFLSAIWIGGKAQKSDIYDRPARSEPSHFFDVLHYRIALNFEGKNHAFEGETTVVLRSLKDGFKRFSLDAETYEVQTITGPDNQPLAFSYKEGKLQITLAQPKNYGDTTSVIITYGTESFQVDPAQFGMGANYPLGIGFFDAQDNQPFLFNAYSFPTGARHWFPCYDHPNDRATHETIITTFADHKVLANGLLQSVTENDNGTRTYHWAQNQPHPTYLYNFVSGPYTVIEDEYHGLPVNYWVYPNDEDRGRRSFHRTPEVLAFFEDYYGVKYPWDKFDQIIVPGIGGGAEATTATLIGASTLHDQWAEPDFPSHWLVAHEAAHHWWGDLISYRDWTETWMSEGFATFSEYLYSNHLYGPDEGALNLLNKLNSYLNEAKNRYQRPIVFNRWKYPNQNFDRHTYQKGALVLNMLRDYFGEPTFKRILQHFLTTHAFQPVDTHDFMKSIWEISGQNMDWFFDQWIFGAGHPVLEINYEWRDQELILTVEQTQDTSQHLSLFKMPVKVGITAEDQTEIKQIWLNDRKQTFTFNADTKPQLVRFDVGNVLLKEWNFPKSKEELIYQAQRDDAMGRMWAMQQLSGYAHDPEVKTFLSTQSKEDDFWAVRRAALQTLATNQDPDPAIFREALNDKHSQVRSTAVAILGDFKRPAQHELFKKMYKNDTSYVVKAALVRAIGKLQKPSDQSFFEEVAKTKSPRNVLTNAANWALQQLPSR